LDFFLELYGIGPKFNLLSSFWISSKFFVLSFSLSSSSSSEFTSIFIFISNCFLEEENVLSFSFFERFTESISLGVEIFSILFAVAKTLVLYNLFEDFFFSLFSF
jgi:hypothetical protein